MPKSGDICFVAYATGDDGTSCFVFDQQAGADRWLCDLLSDRAEDLDECLEQIDPADRVFFDQSLKAGNWRVAASILGNLCDRIPSLQPCEYGWWRAEFEPMENPHATIGATPPPDSQ